MNWNKLLTLNLLFVSLLLASKVHASNLSIKDSIGIEKKNGKNFILHKVEPKETLYSISRKYKVEVAELKKINADIAGGLKIGQVMLIPYAGGKVASSPDSKTSSSSAKSHKVVSKETLYSISRKYNVSIEDIKKANPSIASKGIHPGDELVIPSKYGATAKVDSPKGPSPKGDSKESTVAKATPKEDVKERVTPKPEPKVETKKEIPSTKQVAKVKEAPVEKIEESSANASFKKITESGLAEVMEDRSGFHVGLHKSAPVGTIVQVKNEENNSKIFLRVIGKLQESRDDKVILRMSPKAFERLGVKDDKVPVSISYIP